MGPDDQWTVSIYDQAIAYAALQGLARMNAAAGRDQERARWMGAASELREVEGAASLRQVEAPPAWPSARIEARGNVIAGLWPNASVRPSDQRAGISP